MEYCYKLIINKDRVLGTEIVNINYTVDVIT